MRRDSLLLTASLVSVLVLILVNLVPPGVAYPKSGESWKPVAFPPSPTVSRKSHNIAEDTRKVTLRAIPAKHNEVQGEKEDESETERASSSSWYPPAAEYRVIQKVLDECLKSSYSTTCLKGKAITFLDRVSRMNSIPIYDGIFLSRQHDAVPLTPALSKDDLEVSLLRNLDQKSDKLDQLIYDSLINLWNTHTLTIDFTSRDTGEGRYKKKKYIGHLIMGLTAAAATVGSLAFKSLAALAFKALIVAKVALVLSSILALKKLNHHGHEGGGEGGRVLSKYSWKWKGQSRAFPEATTQHAHGMAYSAQLQRPSTVS